MLLPDDSKASQQACLAGCLPACLVCCRLWGVGGPPTEASTAAFLGCAVVGPRGELDSSAAPEVPAEALQRLEGRDGSEAEALAAANEARQQRRASRLAALRRRRKYGAEEIEERKSKRRDVRAKAAAAARQQQE